AGKRLRPTRESIGSREAKREALRAVCRRLLERGEAGRVLPLALKIYNAEDAAGRAEGVAVAGLELLRHGDRALAEKAGDDALAAYAPPPQEGEEAPPPVPALRPAVVALALAVGKKPPKRGKGLDEEENEIIGRAEGLARQGKWAEARQLADKPKAASARLRARVALAQ